MADVSVTAVPEADVSVTAVPVADVSVTTVFVASSSFRDKEQVATCRSSHVLPVSGSE